MKPVPFRYWLFASVWSSVVLFRKANHFSGFCYCGWHVNVRLVCILWRMWKSVYGCMSLCRTWSVNFPWVWLDSKVNQFWLSHSVVKSFFGQNTSLTIFLPSHVFNRFRYGRHFKEFFKNRKSSFFCTWFSFFPQHNNGCCLTGILLRNGMIYFKYSTILESYGTFQGWILLPTDNHCPGHRKAMCCGLNAMHWLRLLLILNVGPVESKVILDMD